VPSLPRLALSVLASLLLACIGGPHVGSAPPASEGPPPVSAVGVASPPTLLLTAHVQPPGPGDRDYVLPVRAVVHLLFSRPIDPLSLAPQDFVLALASGSRIMPVGAFLSAGAEPGESRSVALLIAEPPRPAAAAGKPVTPPAEPISVTVTGLLHDAEGRVLEGLSVDVVPREQPVFPVRVETAAGLGCRGYEQALRVFWSAPVRRPETAPAPQVLRIDGKQGPADAAENDDTADDAVLDFCLRGAAAGSRIELPAGVAADLRGSPTAAASLPILPGLPGLPGSPTGPNPSPSA
jgi:hypothetical protein